jgi:hypothetical protein
VNGYAWARMKIAFTRGAAAHSGSPVRARALGCAQSSGQRLLSSVIGRQVRAVDDLTLVSWLVIGAWMVAEGSGEGGTV